MTKLCENPNPWVVREAARAFVTFSTNYDQLELWLKFATANLCIDSANMRLPKVYGRPLKLPPEKGMHDNWGAFFSFGDLIVLDDPIVMHNHTWSISFWMTIPPIITDCQHTLLQSVTGARYIVLDETGLRLGIYDTKARRYHKALKLNPLKPYTWHSIIITYDHGNIRYDDFVIFSCYVDYLSQKKLQAHCEDPIRYVGNSADGKEPFGTFCDLRITTTIFTNKQRKHYSCYAPRFLDLQPDYPVILLRNAVTPLAKALSLRVHTTVAAIIAFFANLAANGKPHSD